MKALTSRQREILRYICVFREEAGHSPTMREIGTAVGIVNPQAVAMHLNALQRKGYVSRKPGQARTITVLREVA